VAKSGIPWIDWTFELAVRSLVTWAKAFGITYEEINVYLFCIAWPVVTLGMTVWIVYLLGRVRKLKAIGQSKVSDYAIPGVCTHTLHVIGALNLQG